MAIGRRIKVTHEDVFSHGAFLVGDVTPVWDFERSTRETRVQEVDEESGLLIWQVDVVDSDPAAMKRARSVTVKLLAKVQPVPPESLPGLPFRPVEFDGLTATPWIDDSGPRPKVMYSYRAAGMKAPKSRPAGNAA